MGRARQEFKKRNPMARELREPHYRQRIVPAGGRRPDRKVSFCSFCGEELAVGEVCDCNEEGCA